MDRRQRPLVLHVFAHLLDVTGNLGGVGRLMERAGDLDRHATEEPRMLVEAVDGDAVELHDRRRTELESVTPRGDVRVDQLNDLVELTKPVERFAFGNILERELGPRRSYAGSTFPITVAHSWAAPRRLDRWSPA
jgi:hypothetical protein